MDFVGNAPSAVREYLTALLEGNSWEPQGFQSALADAEGDLAEIVAAIEVRSRCGQLDTVDDLRIRHANLATLRDMLAGEVSILTRLGLDERMQEAYALLPLEFTDDDQWRDFISAAWAARLDYSSIRDRLKRANELKIKIAETAEELAKLIKEFSETGVNGPGEFFSVPALLRRTDNHDMQGHNLRMWRWMRKYILGDTPNPDFHEDETAKEANGKPLPPERICSPLQVAAMTRDADGNAWGRLLEFPDNDGRAHQWAMPLELLAGDGNNYRRALLSMGLEIAPSSRARQRLTEYIQTAPVTARAACVQKTGWHDGVFVLADETLGENGERILLQSLNEPPAMRTAGTVEQWRDSLSALVRP